MIHCEKCLALFTNSVGSGTVLCKECQAKGEPDIFDTQPTCGELSCDECNERYKKAAARIAALEEVVRKLTKNFTCRCDYSDYCNECSRMADTCTEATAILNGGK